MNVAIDHIVEEISDFLHITVGVSLPVFLHLFSFFVLTILPIRTGISITQLHRAQREERGREERGRVTEHHALSSLRLLHLFFAVSCSRVYLARH